MSALTADRETTRKEVGFKQYPCGVDIIYKGSMVGIPSDGYAEAMVPGTCLRFGGVAYDKVDNSGGSNGDKYTRCYTEGVFLFAASSITQAMVGQMMYAVDDQTFDDDPGAYAIPVGVLVEYISATSGWIDIGRALGVEKVRINIPASYNRGGDADWAANASGLSLDQNLSGKIAYIPISGLQEGDRIVSIEYAGGIGAKSGGATTLDIDLYKVVGKAGGDTDTEVQSCTQVSKEADYKVDETQAVATPEVVAEDTAYYFKATGTCADNAENDIILTSLALVVERQRG